MSVHQFGDRAACCRRSFLKGVLGCGAYVAYAMSGAPGAIRRAFAEEPAGEAVIKSEFARIEAIGENVWSVISTPEGGFVTVSNGGIIAGEDAVLAIEGFMTPKGATWLRDAALELTGRAPTHVALTHFHGDHIGGLKGLFAENSIPTVAATASVRDAIPEAVRAGSDAPAFLLVDDSEPKELDLGGRKVRLVPRRGHTPSDLTIELADPQITWCGDLLWNGMFPNYVDAMPSALTATCHDLLNEENTMYVPGHGSIGDRHTIAQYLELLEFVADAAQGAVEAGTPAAEAWKSFSIPASLGTWGLFRPNIYQAAFEAWERELKA